MIRPARSHPLPALLALVMALVVAAGACTPAAGSLGTPAAPPSSGAPTGEPAPEPSGPGGPDATPDPSPTGGAATPTPPEQPSGTPSAGGPSPTPTTAPEDTVVVRAYFILGSFTGNEGLVPVLREVPRTKAVATAAMAALLEGPSGAELAGSPAMSTAVPSGTRLLGLSISGGVATVDLSREFESGGGSFSILGRLAQVVYTLTQFPTVDAVQFRLDGRPVEVFSGEGVVLDKPVGRDDYRDLLPAVFVDRPAWGAAIGNPARISGLANVFEATFQVQLKDARGVLLANRHVTATCGTGCWGSFAEEIPYTVASGQYGTLRVFVYSARDGAEESVTEYRVWLTPAR